MSKGKKVILAIIIPLVGLFVVLPLSIALTADEKTKQKWEEERQREEAQERLEQQKATELKQQELEKSKFESILDAKKELDNYLDTVKKATLECTQLPNEVKISSYEQQLMDDTVVNSALMVLLIEEAQELGYNELLPYKQKIINSVDELIECINRH